MVISNEASNPGPLYKELSDLESYPAKWECQYDF